VRKAKFYIEVVNNGFVLRFKSHGLSPLKEPYEPGVYVFSTLLELNKFIEEAISD